MKYIDNSKENKVQPVHNLLLYQTSYKKKLKILKSILNLNLKELTIILKKLIKLNSKKPHIKSLVTNLTKLVKKIEADPADPYVFFYKDADGRLTSKSGPNLQVLRQDLRNIALGDNYIELDIKNCHPTIYLALGLFGNLSLPYLTKYIKNPESEASSFGIQKELLKRVLLISLNGGNSEACINHLDLETQDKINKTLLPELEKIQDYLFNELKFNYTELFNKWALNIKKESKDSNHNFNLKGKMVNRILRLIESNILDLILMNLKDNSLLPLHDGVIMLRGNLRDDLIPFLENLIFKEFNLKVILKVKELSISKSIPEIGDLEEHIIASPNNSDELGLGFTSPNDSNELSLGFDSSTQPCNIDDSNELSLGFDSSTQPYNLDESGLSFNSRGLNHNVKESELIPPFNVVELGLQLSMQYPQDRAKSDYTLADIILEFLVELHIVIKDESNVIWILRDGLWINDTSLVYETLINIIAGSTLGFYVINKQTLEQNHFLLRDNYPYLERVIKYVLTLIPKSSFYMTELIESQSLNKLLLSDNVVYDWEHKIYRPLDVNLDKFAVKMDFSSSDLKAITDNDVMLWRRLYIDLTFNIEDLDYLGSWLAASVSGINSFWKQSLFIIGPRDSGKSVLVALLGMVFGGLVASNVNGTNFQKSQSTLDAERILSFAYNFFFQRVATVSELDPELPFNVRIIKLIQGRDIIHSRLLFKNPVRVQTGTSILFVNNVLIQGPPELYNHIDVMETPHTFTTNKNPNLLSTLGTRHNKACFVKWLMLNWKNKPPVPSEEMEDLKSNLMKVDTGFAPLSTEIFDKYFLVENESFLTFEQLRKFVLNLSDNRSIKLYDLIKFLKSKGAVNYRMIIDNKRVRVLKGIKLKQTQSLMIN